jgi:hypothetical protein
MRTARQISAQAKASKKNIGLIGASGKISIDNIIMSKAESLITVLPKTQSKDNIIIKYIPENIKGEYLVTNANGYTVAQLETVIPKNDYECIELYGKNLFQDDTRIPVNYGLGIEIEHEGEQYIMKRGGHSWRSKPTVTLETRSWRGISIGAIHYYGDLHINLPDMVKKNTDGHTRSCHYFPMFSNNQIKLTQVLEQWEKDKYPENYEYLYVGQNHDGFYTEKQLKDYGKEVFEKIFAEGWQFRIEEH